MSLLLGEKVRLEEEKKSTDANQSEQEANEKRDELARDCLGEEKDYFRKFI